MIKRRQIETAETLVPVDVDKVPKDSTLSCPVFVKDGLAFVCFLEAGGRLTDSERDVLRERKITELFLRRSDAQALEAPPVAPRLRKPPAIEAGESFSRYSDQKEQYFQIERSILSPGLSVPFSIHVLKEISWATLISASEHHPVSIDESVLSVEGDFCINKTDVDLYRDFLNGLMQAGAEGKTKKRTQVIALKENSKLLVKDLLDSAITDQKVRTSVDTVNTMIDGILDNRNVMYDLLTLNSFDSYTYAHSVNVAVLAIGLGVTVGLPREDVERLGIGALLHDVGKKTIPHEILNKMGRLTNQEYQVMQQHVPEGEKIVRSQPGIPREAVSAVVEHHEKLSGKGYPAGLSDRDVSLFGRITGIVDCYDALTTHRPYRKAMKPFYALARILQEKGEYDRHLLREFISMLGGLKVIPSEAA